MKRKKLSLTDELSIIKQGYQHVISENRFLIDRNRELERDNNWLRQLIQNMIETMNNGSKEGIFPRRST